MAQLSRSTCLQTSAQLSFAKSRSLFGLYYTDGSKKGKYPTSQCHSATIDENNRTVYRLKLYGLNDIYSAELSAIWFTLKKIKNKIIDMNKLNDQNIKNFIIVTDSLSAINKIESTYYKNIHNFFLININLLLAEFETLNIIITIIWTPSHIGIKGNELADQVAKNNNIIPHHTSTYKP
ncbi:uncharacterized protein [Prorops nasuta]|uniref:uncharacterized protein n=1 Tax=Prorops nasuta TaxID=863751 RepID=UPI0034CD59DB